MFSPLGIIDFVFGTSATLISVLFILWGKTRNQNIYIIAMYPVIFNALIVGAELTYLYKMPYAFSALSVAIGEFVAMVVGIVIVKMVIKKYNDT